MSDYLQQESSRFYESLLSVYTIYYNDPTLTIIVNAIVKEAAETAYNAGMSGYHDDRGASASIERLKMFLHGIAYGRTSDRENLGPYGKLYDQLERKNDPKYQEYLRLKEIYGDM